MNTRKDGYYWITMYYKWMPAYWNEAKGLWYLQGLEIGIMERDIQQIDETPITRNA